MPQAILHRCLVLTLVCLWGAAAADEKRVALLIGNSEYQLPQLALRNPGNDVRALGEVLQNEGFDVISAIDKDLDQMRAALAEFSARAQHSDMALFFFAGHGVQMRGENYFLGVGYDGTTASEAQQMSLNLTEVRETIVELEPQAGLIIIDACRDTPFSDRVDAPLGLARARGGAGLMIAYATDPGNVALDGEGENSVFTEALLEHVGTPGLDVRLMLGRVRQQVVLETGGLQVPWVEEALLGEHVISTADHGPVTGDAVEREINRWRRIAGVTDEDALKAYIEDYPEGLFTQVAKDRLDMLRTGTRSETFDVAADLAGADRERVAAALGTIGVLTRGAVSSPDLDDDLSAAFQRYSLQLPNPEEAGLDRLFNDATRTAMVLAGATAQQIRTDIVALRSVERAIGVASDALQNIEEIARRNPAAQSVLDQGREDFAAILDARETILRRLDQSREYYDTLLRRAALFAPKGASVGLIGAASSARSLSEIDVTIRSDAELFLQHVSRVRNDLEGSYIWLADFSVVQ